VQFQEQGGLVAGCPWASRLPYETVIAPAEPDPVEPVEPDPLAPVEPEPVEPELAPDPALPELPPVCACASPSSATAAIVASEVVTILVDISIS
jgi:hypothetical protein